MRYEPRVCPYLACSSNARERFRFQRKGFYRRLCDGRHVQRFRCLRCRRYFSLQSFRLDYGLHKPRLSHDLFAHFVSKVTHRQSARLLGCSRKTVLARLALIGAHARELQARLLSETPARRFRGRTYQLDEQETFEGSRRLAPVTVPILIDRSSFFVVHADTAPMPARGGLDGKQLVRKLEREARLGKRRSGSRAAVDRCLAVLERTLGSDAGARLESDRKSIYRSLVRERFGDRLVHRTFSSRLPRTRANSLFAINHVLAMTRDGLSRLVPKSWAAAKRRSALEDHLWVWILWRNYVRAITNSAPGTTSAMALGVTDHRFEVPELLGLRATFRLGSGARNGATSS